MYPQKTARNKLILKLRKKGKSYHAIGNDPKVIELSGGKIGITRVFAICKREKSRQQINVYRKIIKK